MLGPPPKFTPFPEAQNQTFSGNEAIVDVTN